MNRQQNPAVISRQAKLEREENAFRDTKLEDIEFVAGVRRMIVPAVCSLSGIVVMFCGKNLLEHFFVHKERDHSADGTVERVLIVIAVIACIAAAGHSAEKSAVTRKIKQMLVQCASA